MAVVTKSKPLLELAIELIDRYNSEERAVVLDEISKFGTYKGKNVHALISTLYQYYDHYEPKGLEDRLNYLSHGDGLKKAREQLHHIQTTPEEHFEQSTPPEPQQKDIIDKFTDNQFKKIKVDATKEIAKDDDLRKEIAKNEELAREEASENITPERLAEIKAKRLSPEELLKLEDKKLSRAERLIYGSVKNYGETERFKRQLTQVNNQKDPLESVLDNAQHHAKRELKAMGQEVLEKQVTPFIKDQLTRRFGPSMVYPTNRPSPISSPIGNFGSSVSSNLLNNVGSKIASAVAQQAARTAASAAAAVAAPISGIAAIIIGAIIIGGIFLYFFFFYPNTFAPYNPVPIPTESTVVAPGENNIPPPGSSNNSVVNWALQIANQLRIGPYVDPKTHTQGYDQMEGTISTESYSAVTRQGINGDTTPEGLYWCTNLVIDSYNLAGIPGLNGSHQGVINMLNFWQSNSGYKFYDYQKNDPKTIIGLVKPGQVIFLAQNRNAYTGSEHVAIVSDVTIDSNGNGSIKTINSNSTNIIITFTVVNGVIQNPFYPVIGFGGT